MPERSFSQKLFDAMILGEKESYSTLASDTGVGLAHLARQTRLLQDLKKSSPSLGNQFSVSFNSLFQQINTATKELGNQLSQSIWDAAEYLGEMISTHISEAIEKNIQHRKLMTDVLVSAAKQIEETIQNVNTTSFSTALNHFIQGGSLTTAELSALNILFKKEESGFFIANLNDPIALLLICFMKDSKSDNGYGKNMKENAFSRLLEVGELNYLLALLFSHYRKEHEKEIFDSLLDLESHRTSVIKERFDAQLVCWMLGILPEEKKQKFLAQFEERFDETAWVNTVVINYSYRKDPLNRIWCVYIKADGYQYRKLLNGADGNTFEAIGYDEYCGKDKNNVYISGQKVENADPQTFLILDTYRYGYYWLSKDKESVYLCCEKLKDIDASSIEICCPFPMMLIKDKNSVFRIKYKNKPYEVKRFLSIDIGSFKMIGGFYARDKNSIFSIRWDGVYILLQADRDSFKAYDEVYVCDPAILKKLNEYREKFGDKYVEKYRYDSLAIYYLYEKLKVFYDAEDKNYYYNNGKIVFDRKTRKRIG